MKHYATFRRLSEIAEDQWGLVTSRQAELAGVSRATLQRLAAERVLERIARGVYHLTGVPTTNHLDLTAAWLQLAPDVLAWNRTPEQGVISHRSAAALYDLGHLPADRHDFTLSSRRQSRRPDIRLHQKPLHGNEWISLHGRLATRPSRIAADLLDDREDPEAVAYVVADAIRAMYDYPGTFADSLGPLAGRVGLRHGDGLGLLRWLLDLVGDPDTPRWMEEARRHMATTSETQQSDVMPVLAGGAKGR